ncbi:MAG: hemerythrin domain-containing protein, partial [Polyangiaceae bacterium]|nr:hemerythrin domain-containing protein [Polyangiaceae bacterium]
PRWAELGQEPTALPRLAAGLQADTARLAALLDAHLAGEEAIVFPAVREHLSADAPAIRAEMRARRAR